MTETYRVPDGEAELEFSGDLLGLASSETPGKARWLEVRIFKTAAGNYVVQKIGHSRVQHRYDSRCGARILRRDPEGPAQVFDRERFPCEVCYPREGDATINEATYSSAQVATTAEGCVQALHSLDRGDVFKLTIVAEDAGRSAARRDPALASALAVRKVA